MNAEQFFRYKRKQLGVKVYNKKSIIPMLEEFLEMHNKRDNEKFNKQQEIISDLVKLISSERL